MSFSFLPDGAFWKFPLPGLEKSLPISECFALLSVK
jgi:hypothetical protein